MIETKKANPILKVIGTLRLENTGAVTKNEVIRQSTSRNAGNNCMIDSVVNMAGYPM
jgi:hypothetical protein